MIVPFHTQFYPLWLLPSILHLTLPSLGFFSPTHNSLKYIGQNNIDGPKKEQIEDTKKSDEVLFYVLAGIISVILICIFAVILILKKYQIKDENKSDNCEDPLEAFDIIDITDQDLMVNPEAKNNDVTLPTFYKVCIFYQIRFICLFVCLFDWTPS